MKIIFAGTPDFSVPSLKRLAKEDGIKIEAVITQPDRRRGRGKKLRRPPVKKEAISHGLDILQPEDINDRNFIDKIKHMDIDLMVVVAYGQILSKELLSIPDKGCINLHASLLPEYRGSSPIQQAILDGKKITGVTTMFMDEGLDTGEIIYQKRVRIKKNYNAGNLHDRLAEEGAKLLIKTILDLKKDDIKSKVQNEEAASYTKKINKNDGLIDWEKSSRDLYYFIKAMNPWPGSFTYLDNKLLKIFEAEALEKNTDFSPGTVVKADPKKGLFIQTGDGLLKIEKLQLAGKRRMPTADFLRGYSIKKGNHLDSKRE